MKYTRLEAFCTDYAPVAIGREGSYKWGVIDRNGVEVVQTIYDSLIYMGGEHVLVNRGQYDDFENMEFVSGLWGVVSVGGEFKIELKYTELHWANSELSLLIAQNSETDKQGVIDIQENIIIPFEYSAIYPTFGCLLQIQAADAKNGLIDLNNNTIIDPIYDELSVDWRVNANIINWIAARKGNELYYIDYEGNRMLF